MRRKCLVFLLAVLMILSLAGCHDTTLYDGNHPELFVIATHSLLGVWGGWRQDTLILEEDAFGRVMFAYVGSTLANDARTIDNLLAILIAQRTTEYHSYFYSGNNFILLEMQERQRSLPDPTSVFFNEEFVMERFIAEQIEQLKMENSWNEPLDEDRFFRVPVSRRRKTHYMTYVLEEAQREAYIAVARGGQFSHPSDSVPLTMDKNGNVIFFMRGSRFENGLWVYYPAFLFMFDADGNLIEGTGVMELTDLWDYREQLREFKEANGWSFYYR